MGGHKVTAAVGLSQAPCCAPAAVRRARKRTMGTSTDNSYGATNTGAATASTPQSRTEEQVVQPPISRECDAGRERERHSHYYRRDAVIRYLVPAVTVGSERGWYRIDDKLNVAHNYGGHKPLSAAGGNPTALLHAIPIQKYAAVAFVYLWISVDLEVGERREEARGGESCRSCDCQAVVVAPVHRRAILVCTHNTTQIHTQILAPGLCCRALVLVFRRVCYDIHPFQ